MNDQAGVQRRILTGISPLAWEHPADRAALNTLRKVPGFDLALRKVFGLFGERALRLAFKANAVRVSPNQYPWVHERHERVCEVLDVDSPPEVYISQTPIVNAGAVGMSDPFIVLNSSMLEVLGPDEVEAVLGHEVGHILSGHVLYRTLLILILNLVIFRYTLAGLAIRPILMALLEWYRKSELSSDRAGLLAVQDADATMRSLMLLAGGTRGETLDLEDFVAQGVERARSDAPVRRRARRGIEGLDRVRRLRTDHSGRIPAPGRRGHAALQRGPRRSDEGIQGRGARAVRRG
jgi:Zn-dependent protease with chaperone function